MDSQLVFGIYVLTSLTGSVVIAKLYLWPWLKRVSTEKALQALIAPQALLRLIGLGFLVPGVVSTSMPSGFAIPAAGGDYLTALLALVVMVAVHSRSKLGRPAAWVFNIVGTVDLLNAFAQASRHQMSPTYFGAACFIPTAVVPPLLVVHWLVFLLLLRRKSAA
jgi:hypothetical protein